MVLGGAWQFLLILGGFDEDDDAIGDTDFSFSLSFTKRALYIQGSS